MHDASPYCCASTCARVSAAVLFYAELVFKIEIGHDPHRSTLGNVTLVDDIFLLLIRRKTFHCVTLFHTIIHVRKSRAVVGTLLKICLFKTKPYYYQPPRAVCEINRLKYTSYSFIMNSKYSFAVIILRTNRK